MVFIVKLILPIPEEKKLADLPNLGRPSAILDNKDEKSLKEDQQALVLPAIKIDFAETSDADKAIAQEPKMAIHVRKILQNLKITNAVWCTTDDKNSYLVEFYVIDSDQLDCVLDKLANHSVGRSANSLIIVTEASASVVPSSKIQHQANEIANIPSAKGSLTTFQKFVSTLKSRLTVAQVYHAIRRRGEFTVDFLAFLLSAAVVADVALVTNRPPVIVASMLLSPMMDPILCILFGLRLREKNMIKQGVRNTAVAILLCFSVGLLLGIITHNIAIFEVVTPYPTPEISSRGTLNFLPNTFVVTVFSGVSTAFAILNNVVSALIGNAISLSILPPAVNSGHLVFLTILSVVDRYKNVTAIANSTEVNCNYDWIRNYDMIYRTKTCDIPEEFAINACFSMIVTLMNITCIILIGYVICIIKDFAPNAMTNQTTKKFFQEDIKEAQDSCKTAGYQDLDPRDLAREVFQEYKRCMGISGEADPNVVAEDFSAVLSAVEEDPDYLSVKREYADRFDVAAEIRNIAQNENIDEPIEDLESISSPRKISTANAPLPSRFRRHQSLLPHFRVKNPNDSSHSADPESEHVISLMRRPHAVSMSSYERQKMVRGVARKLSISSIGESDVVRSRKRSNVKLKSIQEI